MVTPVAPSTSNINDRLQCRRHLKADESGATAGILAIRLRPMRCPRRKVGLPEQFSLFADRLSGPEGLRYSEEFVSPAAEKTLMGQPNWNGCSGKAAMSLPGSGAVLAGARRQ